MFGLVKFSFFVFLAALTGLAATSIPFGGKTLSARIGEWWATPAVQQAVVEAESRVERGVQAAKQPAPGGGKTAPGPSPKVVHDSKAKAEVDRIVARRSLHEGEKDHRHQAPPRGK